MVESREDPIDRDDEDEPLEAWQQEGLPERASGVPPAYSIQEPNACTLLGQLAHRVGAVTAMFDYAALERYLDTQSRIEAGWPRLCPDCSAEFREPPKLVRDKWCRRRRARR